MKYNLTNSIIHHVLDNLGITLDTKLSLKHDTFLLESNIEFLDDDGNETFAKLWGSQIAIESTTFRIMVVDFSDIESEYALIIKLDNCPTYACYLKIDQVTNDPNDGLICFSFKPNNWLKSNISIQATFLAGMENLKDINGVWNPLMKYEDLLEEIKSFIQYQETISGIEG